MAPETIPDRERCCALLGEEGLPPHIVDHSKGVAKVALALARALNDEADEALDLALVEAGALLHDISKFHTIQHGGDHCAIGEARARELGLDAIAPIIGRHVDIGRWDPEGPVTAAELINYADKRICHTRFVPLDERFTDLLERYGKTEGSQKRIRAHWSTVEALERKIFSRLVATPATFTLAHED